MGNGLAFFDYSLATEMLGFFGAEWSILAWRIAMIAEIEQRRDELVAACRRSGVRRLELFGSAAVGGFRAAESDIDLLVEFEPLPGPGYADHYFGLLESLESLFARPVDLVVASAIRNPYLRESIDRTKTLLYAA